MDLGVKKMCKLVVPLDACVTLLLPKDLFPHLEIGIIFSPTSQAYSEDQVG